MVETTVLAEYSLMDWEKTNLAVSNRELELLFNSLSFWRKRLS
jgi:hypothetical protein